MSSLMRMKKIQNAVLQSTSIGNVHATTFVLYRQVCMISPLHHQQWWREISVQTAQVCIKQQLLIINLHKSGRWLFCIKQFFHSVTMIKHQCWCVYKALSSTYWLLNPMQTDLTETVHLRFAFFFILPNFKIPQLNQKSQCIVIFQEYWSSGWATKTINSSGKCTF